MRRFGIAPLPVNLHWHLATSKETGILNHGSVIVRPIVANPWPRRGQKVGDCRVPVTSHRILRDSHGMGYFFTCNGCPLMLLDRRRGEST